LQRRFLGRDISGTTFFFRTDRSLGAKQEGLTIVHFLNKLIVRCNLSINYTLYKNAGFWLVNSEHRKMRAKQQHVCKEMNQYILYIRSIPTGNKNAGFWLVNSHFTLHKNAGFWLVNSRDLFFYKFRPCIVNLQKFYFM
jgi:hypothetical protein